MSFHHRLPAMVAALSSSVAVLMAAFAGSSCSFLLRIGGDDDDEIDLNGTSGTFGVLCEHDIFPRDGDRMWELSRIFLIVGLTMGSITAALAWAVASFLTPTATNWSGIAVMASITAVVQVPVFVLFEAEPCVGELEEVSLFSSTSTGLGCRLGPGSYLLIASVLFYVTVTFITQCMDKPKTGLNPEMWKVENRKGSSRRGRKGGYKSTRNDDNENENDDGLERLNGMRSKSIVDGSSEGGHSDEDPIYKISRILPAGEAKQLESSSTSKEKSRTMLSRVPLIAKLFPSSVEDDMDVPFAMTQSMSADEAYDYENQLMHDLEIVRVLPPTDPENFRPPQPRSESGSGDGQEISIGFHDNVVAKETVDRSFQSFNAVLSQPKNNPIVEQHQMIDSPDISFLSTENKEPVISDVNDILSDLKCHEMNAIAPQQSKITACSPFVPEQDSKPTTAPTAPDSIVEGVQLPTNKLKSADSKRKSQKMSFRKLNIFSGRGGGNGYAQMNSDQSSDDFESTDDDDKNYFNYYNDTEVQPTQGLQLLCAQETFCPPEPVNTSNISKVSAVNMSGLSDGLEEQIKDIYVALHEDKEDSDENSLLDGQEDHRNAFDAISIGSTHSDPGPISFNTIEDNTEFTSLFTDHLNESGQSNSFTDFLFSGEPDDHTFETNFDDEPSWDNDFSIGGTTFTTEDSQEPPRGRSQNNDVGRRRRRPVSPVGSVKSRGSLLHMTIDEETEEDVKNELDPNSAPYPIKRTLSCPEVGSVVSPIKTRREKSTNELLKKLEAMKVRMKAEVHDPIKRERSELPPLSPRDIGASPNSDRPSPAKTVDATDDSSAVLSGSLSSPEDNESDASPRTNSANRGRVPLNLQTGDEKWKDLISPLKDNPSRESRRERTSPAFEEAPKLSERWKNYVSPTKDVDISDETSETGRTRSTISYDSDDSSVARRETGPTRIRSKSVGRNRRRENHSRKYRTSNSLSPTRRKNFSSDGRGSCLKTSNLSSLARESRIRRLQQLRKGYLPLENDRNLSPPRYREPYSSSFDPASDPELTPKRKTAAMLAVDQMSHVSSEASSEMPNGLFQPSLLDPDQECPEFDNILNSLDLQLIDLNRPIGAEYGADEGSM